MVTTAADRQARPAVMALISREDRNAELMFRALRWLRTKGIEERPLSWTPGTRVRHEALATSLAGRAVSVPEVLGVAETPDDDAAIVLGATAAEPLAEREDLDDPALANLWEQVALLAATRVVGVPVEWLFPVVIVIPFLICLGWFYVRRATAQEQRVRYGQPQAAHS